MIFGILFTHYTYIAGVNPLKNGSYHANKIHVSFYRSFQSPNCLFLIAGDRKPFRMFKVPRLTNDLPKNAI